MGRREVLHPAEQSLRFIDEEEKKWRFGYFERSVDFFIAKAHARIHIQQWREETAEEKLTKLTTCCLLRVHCLRAEKDIQQRINDNSIHLSATRLKQDQRKGGKKERIRATDSPSMA